MNQLTQSSPLPIQLKVQTYFQIFLETCYRGLLGAFIIISESLLGVLIVLSKAVESNLNKIGPIFFTMKSLDGNLGMNPSSD